MHSGEHRVTHMLFIYLMCLSGFVQHGLHRNLKHKHHDTHCIQSTACAKFSFLDWLKISSEELCRCLFEAIVGSFAISHSSPYCDLNVVFDVTPIPKITLKMTGRQWCPNCTHSLSHIMTKLPVSHLIWPRRDRVCDRAKEQGKWRNCRRKGIKQSVKMYRNKEPTSTMQSRQWGMF